MDSSYIVHTLVYHTGYVFLASYSVEFPLSGVQKKGPRYEADVVQEQYILVYLYCPTFSNLVIVAHVHATVQHNVLPRHGNNDAAPPHI